MMSVTSLLVVGLLVAVANAEFDPKKIPEYETMFKNCWKPECKKDVESCLPEKVQKMSEEERKNVTQDATPEQVKAFWDMITECFAKKFNMINENKEMVNEEHVKYIENNAKTDKVDALRKASQGCACKDMKKFEDCFEPKYMEICK